MPASVQAGPAKVEVPQVQTPVLRLPVKLPIDVKPPLPVKVTPGI
jgi:hypothetical protein